MDGITANVDTHATMWQIGKLRRYAEYYKGKEPPPARQAAESPTKDHSDPEARCISPEKGEKSRPVRCQPRGSKGRHVPRATHGRHNPASQRATVKSKNASH